MFSKQTCVKFWCLHNEISLYNDIHQNICNHTISHPPQKLKAVVIAKQTASNSGNREVKMKEQAND
jgi:ribosomal protein L31E